MIKSAISFSPFQIVSMTTLSAAKAPHARCPVPGIPGFIPRTRDVATYSTMAWSVSASRQTFPLTDSKYISISDLIFLGN